MSSLVAFWLTSCLIVTTAWPLDEVRGMNLFSALRNGHPLLSFTTTTTTLTETYITTQWLPSIVCAKLVNVTGPCKQFFQDSPEGRIAHMEEPAVLTFDEETEEADSFMQFNPTMTLKVEPTASPGDLESKATLRLEASRTDTAAATDGPESRGILGQAVMNFFNVQKIERTTITEISTVVQPYTTKTVFIMNCTPSYFTAFPICSRDPRKSSAI